jgi:hypothetical protein
MKEIKETVLQGFGSASGSAVKLRIRIQEGKNNPQNRKKSRIFMFLNTGCSLLRAEGFSCSLGVLYGGLGISKLQFLIKKIVIKFPAINFFNFRSSNPGSGSGIRIAIRKNAGSGSALNQCGSETLVLYCVCEKFCFVIPFYYGSRTGTVISYGSRSAAAKSYGSYGFGSTGGTVKLCDKGFLHLLYIPVSLLGGSR